MSEENIFVKFGKVSRQCRHEAGKGTRGTKVERIKDNKIKATSAR